jgi:phage shock protein A
MVFRRIFKVFQSEAHSVVDKLEDPIKMTEQGIRDLKTDLGSAMQSLAEVKALSIRLQRDLNSKKQQSGDYERKAMQLLQRMQSGDMDQAEAERLASECLQRKESADSQVASLQKDYDAQTNMASNLQSKVEHLKSTIGKYENELVTLRARAKTASSVKKINKQLANVDSSSTVAMLEKMKQKVDEEESLASAYGDVAQIGKNTVDDEIDLALNKPSATASSDSLLELKKKMGIEK